MDQKILHKYNFGKSCVYLHTFRSNDAEQSVGEVNGIIESYENNATKGIALKIASYISPKQFSNLRENPVYRKRLKIFVRNFTPLSAEVVV